MKKKVNVGIIGAGGIANGVHLPSLVEIEEANLVAICDLHIEKAESAAKEYNASSILFMNKFKISSSILSISFLMSLSSIISLLKSRLK